ncbi:MAG: ScyD/ScyE family protein [bacterium]
MNMSKVWIYLACGMILAGGLAGAVFAAPNLEVVASNLDNPRGLAFGPDGALYVAEAGKGGNGPCLKNADDEDTCLGTSGAVTRIYQGQQERIAVDLPSMAPQGGGNAAGPHSIVITSQGAYCLVGLGSDPAARTDPQKLGNAGGQNLGQLVFLSSNGSPQNWCDIAQYEAANNPESTKLDSNPYAVIAVADGFVVADAGGNSLLHVDTNGTITTLATFAPRLVDAPPFLGMPEGTKIPMESVPTCVIQGTDGAFYVGELTGFPFEKGAARVWRVVPGEQPQVFAEGFTNIIGLAVAEDGGFYVLEIAKNSLLSNVPGGALIHLKKYGLRVTVAEEGLIMPTAVTIGPDKALYISNFGAMAGQGQVVRIDPSQSGAKPSLWANLK